MNLLEPHRVAEVRQLLESSGIDSEDGVRVALELLDGKVYGASFEITKPWAVEEEDVD